MVSVIRSLDIVAAYIIQVVWFGKTVSLKQMFLRWKANQELKTFRGNPDVDQCFGGITCCFISGNYDLGGVCVEESKK